MTPDEARRFAGQSEEMLVALGRLSSFCHFISASESGLLRSFLACAKARTEPAGDGCQSRERADDLLAARHGLSEVFLRTAMEDGEVAGVPDLRHWLLSRIIAADHLYLSECEAKGPAEVHPALLEVMRRDLHQMQVLAETPWADLLADAGERGVQNEGLCAAPSVGGELKQRFEQSDDWADLAEDLGCFVHEHGRGEYLRFCAFRLEGEGADLALKPIRHFATFPLDWLEGNEARIRILEQNTLNFLAGHRAHNALIWGPRGGGKSTLIRALVGKFYARGLRAIEITPSCYGKLADLFALVRGRRQRFIGVLDNISLDRGDANLHVLLRILDGGLEEAPDNLVFYATSNYKDLVDREGERPQGLGLMQVDGDRQPNLVNQAIQPEFYDPQQLQRLDEERALDDRFALKVFLDLPHKQLYQAMVLSYAQRAGIAVDAEELLADFEVWRMRHNHDLVGGRTARDFIFYYLPEYQRRQGS